MCTICTISCSIDKVNAHSIFPRILYSKTKDYRLKVRGERPRGQLFHSEVVCIWNEMPDNATELQFLYRCMDRKGLQNYSPNERKRD